MLRSSGFLSKFRLDKNRGDLVYLASNRRSHEMPDDVLQFYTFMDINSASGRDLVPIALGKYLFPFRTQQSSPVAAIILPQAGN